MLVGDVRCAMSGCGSSSKLSGGSQLSSCPAKVSKKRHVRRAASLAARASFAVNVSTSITLWRLTQCAIVGDKIHASRKGAATGKADGLSQIIATRVRNAINSAGHIKRRYALRSCLLVFSACAAVTHSSRRSEERRVGKECRARWGSEQRHT